MSMKVKTIELRLIVEAEIFPYETEEFDSSKHRKEQIERLYKSLESEIKRHCDNVRNVHFDRVTESVCEFCGKRWTKYGNTYNGGCCDDDEAGNPEETEQ